MSSHITISLLLSSSCMRLSCTHAPFNTQVQHYLNNLITSQLLLAMRWSLHSNLMALDVPTFLADSKFTEFFSRPVVNSIYDPSSNLNLRSTWSAPYCEGGVDLFGCAFKQCSEWAHIQHSRWRSWRSLWALTSHQCRPDCVCHSLTAIINDTWKLPDVHGLPFCTQFIDPDDL